MNIKTKALMLVCAVGIILAGCASAKMSPDELAALAKTQKGRIMIDYLITEPPYILELVSDNAEKPGYFITLNGKKIVPAGTFNNYSAQQNLDDFNKKLAEGAMIVLNKVPTDQQSFSPPEKLDKLKEILGSAKSKTEKLIEIQKIGYYYEASDIVEKNCR
jgi:hypothetical protein